MSRPVPAVVVTVSDRSASGQRADASGPRALELLGSAGFVATSVIVADGAGNVRDAIGAAVASGARLVVTSGGTGVGPRDRTPEGTRPLLHTELPGVAEALRREGAAHTPTAVLSRGLVGIAGEAPGTLVVNLPGSVAAVEQGLAAVLPLVPHILSQLDGGDH